MESQDSTKPPSSAEADASPASGGGDELFSQVVRLTGLPAQTIKQELRTILENKNIDLSKLTLEQLRTVAASYLREIMGTLLDAPRRKTESGN